MTEYSAIILAGGKSRRMGQKKALLKIEGRGFVQIIRDKLLKLGIEDIILSGFAKTCEKTRYVKDRFEGQGPLAGIHAGLEAASHDSVIVIAEDAPLVPVEFLEKLCQIHEERSGLVTVASCERRIQPLLGIYDKSLAKNCERILTDNKRKVMSLLEEVGYEEVPFFGEEILIRGCNTPEEYEYLQRLVKPAPR